VNKREKTLWEEYDLDNNIAIGSRNYFDTPSPPQSLDEMWEIRDQGKAIGQTQSERAHVLFGIGAKRTSRAENIIFTGCGAIRGMSLYFKLLNILGIKYNLLPSEYCCGTMLLWTANSEEWDKNLGRAKSLEQRNFELAREQGAKHLYWYCNGCQPIAQFIDTKDSGVTIGNAFDILIEPLKKVKKLKAKPAKVGYYRGCWSFKKAINPDFKLNWNTWRSWLDRIEGIEVVDIPFILCCHKNKEDVIKKIRDSDVDYLVTPCNNCAHILSFKGVKINMLDSLLLEAVTYQG
jgi:hypothetical protein